MRHRLSIKYRFFVNGNQKIKAMTKSYNVFDSKVNLKFSVESVRRKNQGYTPPDFSPDIIKQFSDSTWGYSVGIGFPLFEKWRFEPKYIFRARDYSFPTLISNRVQCDHYFFEDVNCDQTRGLDQKFQDHIFLASFARNSVNNSNIPTTGSNFRLIRTPKPHEFFETVGSRLYTLEPTMPYSLNRVPSIKRMMGNLYSILSAAMA